VFADAAGENKAFQAPGCWPSRHVLDVIDRHALLLLERPDRSPAHVEIERDCAEIASSGGDRTQGAADVSLNSPPAIGNSALDKPASY